MVDSDGVRLGRALTGLRERHGLLQDEVARRAGVVPSYISRLEAGDYRRPSYYTLNRLARAFGLSGADALMCELEAIDTTGRPLDVEAGRIRAASELLQDQLNHELRALDESHRTHVVRTALALVRQMRDGVPAAVMPHPVALAASGS